MNTSGSGSNSNQQQGQVVQPLQQGSINPPQSTGQVGGTLVDNSQINQTQTTPIQTDTSLRQIPAGQIQPIDQNTTNANQPQNQQVLPRDIGGNTMQPGVQVQADQIQGQAGQAGPAEPKVVQPSDFVQGRPAGAKEAEFVSGGDNVPAETVPIIEVQEPGELSPEVAGWVERAEHDSVPEPQTIVHQGQVYAMPSTPQQVKVTLPLDQTQIKQGLHHKVIDSVRWLAEWCIRVVRKYKGQVGYKESEIKNQELKIKN